jgi:Mg2+-importing ATPase
MSIKGKTEKLKDKIRSIFKGKKAQDRKRVLDAFNQRLIKGSVSAARDLYVYFRTSEQGICDEDIIDENRKNYGENKIRKAGKPNLFKRIIKAYFSLFSIILLLLAFVSLAIDYIVPIVTESGDADPSTCLIICIIILLSGTVNFIQESRSLSSSEKLNDLVETTTCVIRNGAEEEIPLDEVVVGDVVKLSAGDIIPADCRVIFAKDLFVSQSSLTGESEPIEKIATEASKKQYDAVTDRENLIFMGCNVVSGAGRAVVVNIGENTIFGKAAMKVSSKPTKTAFDKGLLGVTKLLLAFMLVMVPIVFLLNGFIKGDWLNALLFAVSLGVGLTPEMLPMIVSSSLAKGSINMSKKKVVVKNLNSIQNFGSMTILCTDKTGTLTQDKVVLENHYNLQHEEDTYILRLAFLNSFYQTNLKNLMDKSIIEKTYEFDDEFAELRNLDKSFEKTDEIPFDFKRKRMTVVIKDKNDEDKIFMITKGAIEEILDICKYALIDDKVVPLTADIENEILDKINDLSDDGMRCIAICKKETDKENGFTIDDEKDMILCGYLSFFDPPKESAAAAIKSLHGYGVDIKILTGDNARVANATCRQVGIDVKKTLLGKDVDALSDDDLKKEAIDIQVFAKLSPDQKARVVQALKDSGHVVGYMGDGINDAPALKVADVGISVESGVDIAKETADIILLEKDLNVLKEGVIEGRKTYGNMIKYIKMTASSNFGNMFSVLIASAVLPFLPMLPAHLLILNLIYDLGCGFIPFDNVDEQFIRVPRKRDISDVRRYMIRMGPTSSVFDMVTFAIMFYLLCPAIAGGSYQTLLSGGESAAESLATFILAFQTGWFVESICSQTVVIYLLRSPLPIFIKTRPSYKLVLATLISMGFAIALSYVPFDNITKLFVPLPYMYYLYLLAIIAGYISLIGIVKLIYNRIYKADYRNDFVSLENKD